MIKKIDDVNFVKFNGVIIKNEENFAKTKELLNSTGCGFCLAKWTQVTMHLGIGLTHSCHHPKPHKIPLDELKNNPSALHNTDYKKQVRKQMLNGERPNECDYCWRIEDNTENYSDRVFKSLDGYSITDHDDISRMTGDEDVYPRYVEVSFNNTCNFKCSYCGPAFSSKWAEEIKEYGKYNLTSQGYNHINLDEIPIKEREDNPYIDAFWKWFPDAIPQMHTFRITGGEPLLSKHTFKVIDYLIENPQPNLEFAINTNGCPPDKLWKQFISLLKLMEKKKSVKKITVFISAESTGEQAEYSRYGMKWDLFTKNVTELLEETNYTKISFMSAFNVLSLPTFYNFLEYILKLKRQYNKNFGHAVKNKKISINDRKFIALHNRVSVDIPYIRYPDFLDIKIIDKDMLEAYLVPCLNLMTKNTNDYNMNKGKGFDKFEVDKFERIIADCRSRLQRVFDNDTDLIEEINISKKRFAEFIDEYDTRRFLKFLEVFPEFKEFYRECKNV